MHALINSVVCVIHALDGRESIVEFGLLKVFPVSVDIVQSTVRVDRDEIRRNTHVCPILTVQFVQPEMAVALQAMVELDPGCDRCEEGAVDTAERVDEAIVEGVGEGLE